jgi:hypothetical protein
MTMRREPDAAEQVGERGAIGEKAGRHPLGDAPAVVDVVAMDRTRNVPGLVGFPSAAVDHRANVEDEQARVGQAMRQPFRRDEWLGDGGRRVCCGGVRHCDSVPIPKFANSRGTL